MCVSCFQPTRDDKDQAGSNVLGEAKGSSTRIQASCFRAEGYLLNQTLADAIDHMQARGVQYQLMIFCLSLQARYGRDFLKAGSFLRYRESAGINNIIDYQFNDSFIICFLHLANKLKTKSCQRSEFIASGTD